MSGLSGENVKRLRQARTVEPTTRQTRGQLLNQNANATTSTDEKTNATNVQPSISAGIIDYYVLCVKLDY